METHASILKFIAFVQLKDYRPPTKDEYVRYVRRLGEHFLCDPKAVGTPGGVPTSGQGNGSRGSGRGAAGRRSRRSKSKRQEERRTADGDF
jgi:hypothetical protein